MTEAGTVYAVAVEGVVDTKTIMDRPAGAVINWLWNEGINMATGEDWPWIVKFKEVAPAKGADVVELEFRLVRRVEV